MAEKTVAIKDIDLLKCAKSIFGDIVTDAYITTYRFDNCQVYELKDRLHKSKTYMEYSENRIGYDAENIILIFSNGNAVEFSNSEWASISLVDFSNVEKLK